MTRIFALIAISTLIGCGDGGGGIRDLPNTGSGGSTVERPPLDPSMPAICQEESWPDCPDDVAAFLQPSSEFPGGNLRHVDSKTCSTPKTCAICQYMSKGDQVCRGSEYVVDGVARIFEGNCKAVTRAGTCGTPGDVVHVDYTVFCINPSMQQWVDVCPAT